jgi:ABC-type transporter Mla subunit MlaD
MIHSISSVRNHCDAAAGAFQEHLEQAKQVLTSFEADQQILVQERQTLESIISGLQKERRGLEETIAGIKEQLKELQSELAETQNQRVVANTSTLSATREYPQFNEVSPHTDKHQDDIPLHDDDDDSLNFLGTQAFLETQETTLDSIAGIATQENIPALTDAPSVSTAGSQISRNHRRPLVKVYRSPKKWRRMMRTHRLQSIILNASSRK